MTQPADNSREDMIEVLASVGIPVTEEGKARARRRLAEVDAEWTPERRARLRAKYGRPARAA